MFEDEMRAPKAWRFADHPVLIAVAYIALFVSGFIAGMVATAMLLVRLLP